MSGQALLVVVVVSLFSLTKRTTYFNSRLVSHSKKLKVDCKMHTHSSLINFEFVLHRDAVSEFATTRFRTHVGEYKERIDGRGAHNLGIQQNAHDATKETCSKLRKMNPVADLPCTGLKKET